MLKAFLFLLMAGLLVAPVHAQGVGEASSRIDTAPVAAAPVAPAAGHFAWADVLQVDPVYEMVQVDRERRQCRDVVVDQPEPGHGAAGAVIGAIVGGVLGNTIGKGDGRQAATVAGAVAGGAIGHGVATRDDLPSGNVRTYCENVPAVTRERRITGYDVEYRYRGDVYLSRLAYDPGERLRVRVNVTPAE